MDSKDSFLSNLRRNQNKPFPIQGGNAQNINKYTAFFDKKQGVEEGENFFLQEKKFFPSSTFPPLVVNRTKKQPLPNHGVKTEISAFY